MKKIIKKLVPVLLIFVMLLSVAPLGGVDLITKSSALEASGKCGENVTYTFNESTGLLTISGTGAMEDYISYSYSPFYKDSSIKAVVIKDGITSVGDYAFRSCQYLTSVTIPNSIKSIGGGAFQLCTSLTSITIPYNVASIGNYAFALCTGLTSIAIPDSVTSIGDEAFSYVKNISYSEKMKATSSPWGANSANGYIEDGITYKDSSKTTLLGCPSSKNSDYTIPNSVTIVGKSALYFCSGLTSVTIPDSVISIGEEAFYCCTDLTSVTIGNGVTSIGDNAFSCCYGLKSITIPESVKSIGKFAFGGCENLTSIAVDGNNQYYSNDEYGVLFNKDKTELVQYPAGNSRTTYIIPNGVTSIGNYAFGGCTGLTSVTIPDSVTSIGDFAFDEFLNLKDVYYSSTEEQWNKISIGNYNLGLKKVNVKIHFGSEQKEEPTTLTVNYKSPAKFNPSIAKNAGVGSKIEYKSSNESVATVDENGNVTTHGRGEATITCTVTDESGNKVEDTCTVNVEFTFSQWLIWIFLLGFLWY